MGEVSVLANSGLVCICHDNKAVSNNASVRITTTRQEYTRAM